MTSRAGLRMLLVHAHPDDETITTGATMARYAADGVQVTLVTCTLGEEGEILVPALARLEAAQADQLGGYRIAELAAAMRELGVRDHRFLGGAGCFRDSGMAGSPANGHPRAFWRGDVDPAVFDEACGLLADVVREVRPHVVITYDDNGDYGHPDHVMAHRVTTAAVELARDTWQVSKVYWTATPKSVLAADGAAVAVADVPFTAAGPDGFGFGVDDSVVTAAVTVPDTVVAAKARALASHATQVTVRGDFYALSNDLGRRVLEVEYFRLVQGSAAGVLDADGRETDLFAGVVA